MKCTEFNKKVIQSQICVLQEKYEETKLKSYLNEIEILKGILEDPSEEVYPLPEKFKDLMMEDSLYIRKNSAFIKDINTFSSLSKIMENMEYDIIDTWNISLSSLFSFVHDFYNSLDKEIAKYFNKVFKERNYNFKLSNVRSYMISIPSLNYSYINVENGDTICVYLSMVHEYAHAIADLYKQRTILTSDKYPYIEYFPLFIELIALDKLNDVFEGLENDTTIIKKEKLNLMLSYAKDISIESYYLSTINSFKNKKETIKDLMNLTNINRRYFKEMFQATAKEKILYTIPYIVALESYYQYLDDPKYALNNVKQIITLPHSKEYRSVLEEYDIHLNEHSLKYATELKSKVLKIKQGN